MTTVALATLVPALLVGPAVPVQPLLDLELVTNALREPVGLAGDPAAPDRLYVIERGGRLMLVEDGEPRDEPVLDLSSIVMAEGAEQGLLGIAIHPGFTKNRRLFLYLTDRADRMVLIEYRLRADGYAADPASGEELLAIPDPNPYHNGGQLAFGPDGYLYIGVGDGGLLKGGWRDGRDPASLLGKVLRLDVDATGDYVAYAIPPDNPYVGVAGARPEIWAIGFRNPWRFAFDEVAGDLWIPDVGQLKWEEVNVMPWTDAAGANFGWNLLEGRVCFEAESCDPSETVRPIEVYPHTYGNCAVIGGFVYRGPESRLVGQYLLADYCSGRIWTIDPERRRMELQRDTELLITSFGVGADGSAYVTAQGGELLRIVATR